MAMIHHKILLYVVVSAPKSVIEAWMPGLTGDLFNVSASIWQLWAFKSLVFLAKQSKNQLQVCNHLLTPTVQNYLLIIVNILTITMFPEVLWMRGGTRAYSYRMHVYFTQMYHNFTYADRGDAKYLRQSKDVPPKRITRDVQWLLAQHTIRARYPTDVFIENQPIVVIKWP